MIDRQYDHTLAVVFVVWTILLVVFIGLLGGY
jgi:hypothetical protein